MIELPLFPLQTVLFPYGRLPLQIFERRYIDLVRDSLRTDTGFGLVWLQDAEEPAGSGHDLPQLGDYGTLARIVDWDQLPNGLLGITVQGESRFELHRARARSDGLVVGDITPGSAPPQAPMQPEWASLEEVLRSLETHPHVQRMNIVIDYSDAWQVGYWLAQLLPLEEPVKHELLGSGCLEELMLALDTILNQISD
jgi:Lon protease-like protein